MMALTAFSSSHWLMPRRWDDAMIQNALNAYAMIEFEYGYQMSPLEESWAERRGGNRQAKQIKE